MAEWNAQPVFGGHLMAREEINYDRRDLAYALRHFSPGIMSPLEPRLSAIAVPILWIAGEHDSAYVASGHRAVELLPRAELWICPSAGHRVPWEQPDLFAERLHSFVAAR